MAHRFLETLESRQHLSITYADLADPVVKSAGAVAKTATVKTPKTQAVTSGVVTAYLTAAQVSQILAQAGSQAKQGQAVAVVDREGNVLGVYATRDASTLTINTAIQRARTAGFFASTQDAFTTRTARFIIQDHFPFPIRNTAGGPLYGVEFSSMQGTDVLLPGQVTGVVREDPDKEDTVDSSSGISGDPGGVPLYVNKLPAGGIGVAGDGSNVAPRFDLAGPGQTVFNGKEERDFDESVAMAGQSGTGAPKELKLDARPKASIVATKIVVEGTSLRLPYTNSPTASGKPFLTLAQLVSQGKGTIFVAPKDATPEPFPVVPASVYGVVGELKNTAVPGYGVVASNDTDAEGNPLPDSQKLTVDDVNTIISQAVAAALKIRAAIRNPIGVNAVVHVTVVDRDGNLLGAFRMNDGTNFSFDVAVQKARTAAFFSDDTHAFSTRAIGFMSQRYFPAGIDGGVTGPLFHLQNSLSTAANLGHGPLANGMTIFPGGVPLYKDGVMVGAIGVSGDGVEQDDQISFTGGTGFQPRPEIRSDYLSRGEVTKFIVSRVQEMQNIYVLLPDGIGMVDYALSAQSRFDRKFDFRLPYVKFARHPLIH